MSNIKVLLLSILTIFCNCSVFRSLSLNVIIGMVGFRSAILLFAFYLSLLGFFVVVVVVPLDPFPCLLLDRLNTF